MSATPQIRFFRMQDGRRVAYATHGQGPPLVCSAWWVSHVEADWDNEGFRQFFGGLAEHRTIVRYDRVGAGLSDRERETVELDDEVDVLGSLIDHLALNKTALLGVACAGPPALEYACAHPDRVSQLILFGSFVRGRDVGSSATRDAVQGLVRAHWGLGSTMLSDLFAPDLDAASRAQLSSLQRASASSEMSARLLALTFDMDVSDAASRLQTRSLVVHRKGDRAIPFDAGRELAASMANASLCVLDGPEHLPWYGDVDSARDAVLQFLGVEDEPATSPIGDRQMRREGELWSLSFAGRQVFVKHSRGLEDLAVLLSAPGEEIHVGRLWSGVETEARLDRPGDPVLDEASLRAYKARLAEIEVEIGEAEKVGHAPRAESLRDERAILAQELRAAVGRGGKQRALDDPSERARKAVSSRIRSSLKKILEVHPELGEHLQSQVSTGTYCSYASKEDPAWTIR